MPSINLDNLKCPPFFKIKKDNSVFYILGTCHTESLKSLPDTFLSLIEKAKSLVVESQTDKLLTLDDLYKMRLLTHTENHHWFKQLSLAAQNKFTALAKKFFKARLATEPVEFSKIDPEMAHWIVRFEDRPDDYMDGALKSKFAANTKYLEGIERYEALTTIKYSIAILEKLLTSKQIFESTRLYFNGGWLTYPVKTNPSTTKRNLSWIDKIIQLSATASESPILFAVGAGHLFGPTSIITLLKEKGFEISRINSLGEEVAFSLPKTWQTDLSLFKPLKAESNSKEVISNTNSPHK